MYDSHVVGGGEGVGDLFGQSYYPSDIETTALLLQDFAQGLSVHQLHHDVRSAIDRVCLQNLNDARMTRQIGGDSLDTDSGSLLWIARQKRIENLDGDAVAHLSMLGFVDDSHSASSKLAQNSILPERLPFHPEPALPRRTLRQPSIVLDFLETYNQPSLMRPLPIGRSDFFGSSHQKR